MKKNLTRSLIAFVGLFVCLEACNNEGEKKTEPIAKKDSVVVEEKVAEPKRAPVINITDTLSVKRIVLIMKDSATTMERISVKLGEIYGKISVVVKKNNLKTTGAPMAWYRTQKAPYFFEAGIPVDKRPSKITSGVQVKETGVDSAIVAHFYGPYDLLPQAYHAVKEMLKDRKKKLKSPPYEIYVDDPVDSTGKAKDPYKVQTDIVFPWK
ncbi:MAG: GyrI-like domain-containing protein [Ferruginibacter sp.]